MDFNGLVDLFLNLDKHLEAVVAQYGSWVYALLFTIVFVETGLVVMPILPGDSLLFVSGAVAAVGGLSLPTLMALLISAALLGDSCNYWIGRYFGPKVFQWENSKFFNKAAFEKAHAFYEKHGGLTIIVARFMPFFRTFTPFVAGVAAMTYAKFVFFGVIGALLWVVSLTTLGYLVGNHPWVKANFSLVTLAMIIIPGLPALFEVLRHTVFRRRGKSAIPSVVPDDLEEVIEDVVAATTKAEDPKASNPQRPPAKGSSPQAPSPHGASRDDREAANGPYREQARRD
jgi:membrane-associated protein